MDDDAVLAPRLGHWHYVSHFMQLLWNRRELEQTIEFQSSVEQAHIQKETVKQLQDETLECLPAQILMRRLA